MTFEFSIGVGAKSTTAHVYEATDFADFAGAIFEPDFDGILEELPPKPRSKVEKETLPWVAAPFQGGTRNGKNALPWPVLALDIDECHADDLKLLADLYRTLGPTFGYTTSSHTFDAPRLRIFISLSRPVGADEVKIIAQAIEAHIRKEMPALRWKSDASQQRAGQIAFMPCQGYKPMLLNNPDAAPLNVDVWLDKAAAHEGGELAPKPVSVLGKPDTPRQRAELHSALAVLDSDMPRDQWWKVIASVAAHDWHDSLEIARDWSKDGGKFDAKAERDIADLRAKGGITAATVYWIAREQGWRPYDDCPAPTTDGGLACRFAVWAKDKVMFSKGIWHVWTDAYWRPDENAVRKQLTEFATVYHGECSADFVAALRSGDESNKRVAEAVRKAATDLFNERRRGNVLKAASTLLHVDSTRLDSHHDLLPCPNGTADLRTGALLESNPKHLFTMCASVPYDPHAVAPRFDRFLVEILPDAAERDYLQRLCGYMLTGHVREEVLSIWTGTGANGKSVMLNVLDVVMGDFTMSGEPAVLLSAGQRAGAATPDIARMAGKRLAFFNETRVGDGLNDSAVKRLVSTEKLTARHLNKDLFDFYPTHKVLLRTNNKPKVKDTSDGLWRRLHLLRFGQSFTGERKDGKLQDKLMKEMPGILAWAVHGAVAWHIEGLAPPPSVLAATEAYRADSDMVGEWIDIALEEGGFTPTAELLTSYIMHSGIKHPPTVQEFGIVLRDRGLKPHRRENGRGFKVTIKRVGTSDFS